MIGKHREFPISGLTRILGLLLVIPMTSLIAEDGGKDPKRSAPNTYAQRVDLSDVAAWHRQQSDAARRGFRFLTEKSYLPADLDEEVVAELLKSTDKPIDPSSPEKSPTSELSRAEMLHRYGLCERPGDLSGKPLQYVVDERQQWIMNCFACHGGTVYGVPFPGAPNNRYQLEQLTSDVRSAKLRMAKPLGHMDIGSMVMPLGTTVGSTNAVMFGVALMNYRDADLNIHALRAPARMVHHDMDAPPWWHFHRKRRIYIDGFAEKGARGLMQFMMVKENGPEKFREWEADFEDVYAFIESLRAPKYPHAVDLPLAERGRIAFGRVCARCHGTYGEHGEYPERLIPIEEIGTDRVRLDALTPKHREGYGKSWFAYYGTQETWADPGGYIAPPLDGVWASAPYLHNGSVPSLWHLLNPDLRPSIWKRVSEQFDESQVGLTVESFEQIPEDVKSANQKRLYFDTSRFGKSAEGHDFGLELTEEERRAVLEYLKTL